MVLGSVCQANDMDVITQNNISSNSAAKFAIQLYGEATFLTNTLNNYPAARYELGYYDTSGNVLDARYNYWQVFDPTALRARLYDNYTDPSATQGSILYDRTATYPSVGITISSPWPLPAALDTFQNSSLCTLILETTLRTGSSNYYLINPPDGSYSTYLCDIHHFAHDSDSV